jgi:hypothetical protein
MLAISTHVPFGKVCGALPDGKKDGVMLALVKKKKIKNLKIKNKKKYLKVMV